MEFLHAFLDVTTQQEKQLCCTNLMRQTRRMIKEAYGTLLPPQSNDFIEFHVLSTFPNTKTVFLAVDIHTKRLIVVKQYLHDGDLWALPERVHRQMSCSLPILETIIRTDDAKRKHTLQHNVQRILDLQIQENVTQIIFQYYPVMLHQVFQGNHIEHNTSFVLDVVDSLIRVVSAIHESRAAHRDLKLQNLCFDEHCNLVVLDFDGGAYVKTAASMCVTYPVCSIHTRPPEHMRLECVSNDDQKQTTTPMYYDAQAGDWWSVGCVIAEMFLTGCHLFDLSLAQRLPDLLQHVQEFCVDFESFIKNPATHTVTHNRLKALLRTNSPFRIKLLLNGLLNLNPKKRFEAVSQYLAVNKHHIK